MELEYTVHKDPQAHSCCVFLLRMAMSLPTAAAAVECVPLSGKTHRTLVLVQALSAAAYDSTALSGNTQIDAA